jgi:hypothetical protein
MKMTMEVTYFRKPRLGLELQMQTEVARQIPRLFPSDNRQYWTAGHVPVGAGMPDLVVISSEPEVITLSNVCLPHTHILAYLRTVRGARLDTIVQRLRWSRKLVTQCLEALIEAQTVDEADAVFSLRPRWRTILYDIVTIEVKVEDWRRAIDQASRNSIFSHRSYIALPAIVANRIRSEPIFRQSGIGLLAVNDSGDVLEVRRASRRHPQVWAYYYELASLTARHFGGSLSAVHRAD